MAGIWIESGRTYDLTGDFIKDLATFYNDNAWNLYDPVTGDIKVTDTQVGCEAAAKPNVDAAYNNYCVECSLSCYGGGFSRTYLIPTTPVALGSGTGKIGMSGVGVALDGVGYDAPAPVANIKAAHTIAAFDDCGGHVNPHEGWQSSRSGRMVNAASRRRLAETVDSAGKARLPAGDNDVARLHLLFNSRRMSSMIRIASAGSVALYTPRRCPSPSTRSMFSVPMDIRIG